MKLQLSNESRNAKSRPSGRLFVNCEGVWTYYITAPQETEFRSLIKMPLRA
jgi:hypothetical protein